MSKVVKWKLKKLAHLKPINHRYVRNRQVGDVNRIVREGQRFRDTETGYDVYVRGDKVVIVAPATN